MRKLILALGGGALLAAVALSKAQQSGALGVFAVGAPRPLALSGTITVRLNVTAGTPPLNYSGVLRIVNRATGQTVQQFNISGQVTTNPPVTRSHPFSVTLNAGSYTATVNITLSNAAGSIRLSRSVNFDLAEPPQGSIDIVINITGLIGGGGGGGATVP